MWFGHLHSTKEVPYGLFILHVQLDSTIGPQIYLFYEEGDLDCKGDAMLSMNISDFEIQMDQSYALGLGSSIGLFFQIEEFDRAEAVYESFVDFLDNPDHAKGNTRWYILGERIEMGLNYDGTYSFSLRFTKNDLAPIFEYIDSKSDEE